MDILMVSPELAPHVRASTVGDVVLALSKALCQLEHRVTIAVPRFAGFEAGGLFAARRLTPLTLPGGGEVHVLDAQLPAGPSVALFDAPLVSQHSGGFSGLAVEDAGRLSSLLVRAAAALAAQRAEKGQPFDVIHAHDWAAAPSALLFAGGGPGTVVSIHDGDQRGIVPRSVAADLALPEELLTDPTLSEPGQAVSLLAAGARVAGAVTSVSGAYAADLLNPARGGSLSTVLAARAEPATGILSGLDYSIFNPATDSALKSRYDAEDIANKGRAKSDFLVSHGLPAAADRPLVVAFLGEGADSGEALLAGALDSLLKNDVNVVVMTRGNDAVTATISRLASVHEGVLAVDPTREDAAIRRAMAAADLALLAARYDRTATLARVASRYGAVPVAVGAGAHADAIVDADAELETGTGFLCDAPTVEALLGALGRALSAYRLPAWGQLRRRVMRLDLGWDRPARRYVQVYRQAIQARAKPE